MAKTTMGIDEIHQTIRQRHDWLDALHDAVQTLYDNGDDSSLTDEEDGELLSALKQVREVVEGITERLAEDAGLL